MFKVKELFRIHKALPLALICGLLRVKGIGEWLVERDTNISIFFTDSCNLLETSRYSIQTSEQAELAKFSFRSFFDAYSLLDWLLKSLVFYIISKYLVNVVLKYIKQDVNIKYNLYRFYFIINLWYDNFSRL